MTLPAMTMPVPYTPLYLGLASFVANVLGSIAETDPDEITQRAQQLSQRGDDLRTLVQESQQALATTYGSDAWSGSAADSGWSVINSLLGQLSQGADQAEQESQSLQQIAQLLKSAQDYYTQQSALAEQIVNSLLQNPFSRPLAQLMAVTMGMELAQMMNRFEQAITAVSTNQLTPLWNDADQGSAPSFDSSIPLM